MKWSFAAILMVAMATRLMAQAAATGSAVIIGYTIQKETGQPLGYSVVSIPSLNREQFTGENGGFTMRGLPAGRLTLRFKHIGRSPRDTVLTLGDNDTLRIRIALANLVIQLPAVRVSGTCADKRGDEKYLGILADLFDQVQQNADRYRLLADSNPFRMSIYRARGTRMRDGRIAATSVDTVIRGPFPGDVYAPRQVIRKIESPDRAPTFSLTAPELADFADTAFTNNHCFTYAGTKVLDGESVVAVDFEPVPALKGEVDVKGTMYVRAKGYQLVRVDFELSRLSSELRSTGMIGVRVRMDFNEIVPGVAVLDHSEASTRIRGGVPDAVELGRILKVTWVHGPP